MTNDMFRYGHLLLRCTASIADVYRKSADIDISEDAPRIASITGESPPFNNRKYISYRLCYNILCSDSIILSIILGLSQEYNTVILFTKKNSSTFSLIFLQYFSYNLIFITIKSYFWTVSKAGFAFNSISYQASK